MIGKFDVEHVGQAHPCYKSHTAEYAQHGAAQFIWQLSHFKTNIAIGELFWKQ